MFLNLVIDQQNGLNRVLSEACPPTFVFTAQRIEYLAKLQRNQDSISRWNAKVGGLA
jgi:hypothetical protein